MKNNIEIIKKLRKLTQISITKCCKILKKNNFNIEKSLIYIKKKKYTKKKHSKEGIIIGNIKKNIAVLLQTNCETDFVSKNKYFLEFNQKIINYSFKKKKITLKKINKYFKIKKNYLSNKFNEYINIKKIYIYTGKHIGIYIHNNNKIGVIIKIKTKNNNLNNKKINKIAMHIAAMNPICIKPTDIPKEIIKREKKKILIKNINIKKQILNKKLKKKIKNMSLKEQKFLFNNRITIKEYIKKNKINILKFKRLEIKKNV